MGKGQERMVDSRNGRLAPKVGRVRLIHRPGRRVELADILHITDLLLILDRVGLGRRRRAEPRDVAQRSKRGDISRLRGVRERVGARALLVNPRLLGAVGKVDKVGDLVVGAGAGDLGGGALAGADGFLALGGIGVEADAWDDGAQGGVDAVVQAGAVEDPEERVVRRVGDGQLLELDALVLGLDGSLVDGALDDGLEPA